MTIRRTFEDIKTLRIQGARNIALAAVDSLLDNYKTLAQAKKDATLLTTARPTEPMMRNYLHLAISYLEKGVKPAKADSIIKKEIKNNINKIREYGVNTIPKGAVVLTHCHSSTVTGILVAAKNKNITVYCTETRPKWQGRKTAKELVSNGIDTTLLVDSAVKSVMKKVDLVVIGGDAISARGNLVNKIGTSMIATIAKEFKVPFYSAVEMAKFDPETIYGKHEEIEEREWKEVVEGDNELVNMVKKGKLKIRNPAFDVTLADYISGYICEEGVFKPDNFVDGTKKKFEGR